MRHKTPPPAQDNNSIVFAHLLGILSKNDDDCGENDGKKRNLRSFKLNCVYLDSLNFLELNS